VVDHYERPRNVGTFDKDGWGARLRRRNEASNKGEFSGCPAEFCAEHLLAEVLEILCTSSSFLLLLYLG
jgi:hypothetical protein